MAATGLRYYAKDKGSFAATRPDGVAAKKVPLLWGDEVYVRSVSGDTAQVTARNRNFEIPTEDLMDDPILSWYQIDCGQGDAALIQLPDRRWILVDGGPTASSAPAPAMSFLKWKIRTDQSWRNTDPALAGPFRISALVVSHPDEDHFGGFGALTEMVESGEITVDAVFHNGLGRFGGATAAKPTATTPGFSQLGPVTVDDDGQAWVTQLVDSHDDIRSLSQATAARPWTLTGDYADWLRALAAIEAAGGGVGPLQRVDRSMGTLPGFAGGGPDDATINVIGPLVEPDGAAARLRWLDGTGTADLKGPSLTRNGHSVTLRIDYHDARLMLTGDLNFRAQALLMLNTPDAELRCDVAKACHHGSEDVSWTFLQKLEARATIFSSGDNEDYSHPRATALGMAAALGHRNESKRSTTFLGFSEKQVELPLIYSTELARSVELFRVGEITSDGKRVDGVKIANRPKPGQRKPEPLPSSSWLLANKLIYGLVNVRTDGHKIVIGVLNEGRVGYQTETIHL